LYIRGGMFRTDALLLLSFLHFVELVLCGIGLSLPSQQQTKNKAT